MSSWQLTGGFLSSFDVSDANTISLATLYAKTPTAAQNADAVWDEVLSGHLTAGTTGAALNGAGAAGDPWTTTLPGAYTAGQAGYIVGTNLDAIVSSRATQTSVDTLIGYVDTEVAAIKAKTDNLPADPASAATIASSFTTVNTKLDTIDDFVDTEIAAIKAKTDNLPADPASASSISSSFTTVNGKLDTIDDFLDTEIAAIKAKTDNLPADPASAATVSSSFTTVNGKLDTIDDFLDTEIAAIKAKTDTIPASPAAVSDIPTANQNAAAVLDLADGVETNRTLREALRLILSALAGKLSGAGTSTVTIRDSNDTKNRIVATVDTSGNRTSITYDDT